MQKENEKEKNLKDYFLKHVLVLKKEIKSLKREVESLRHEIRKVQK